jgi:DNA polymerase bacteriophage-type
VIPPPPPIHMLPAGYRLRAGRTWSTVLADFDFETYSEAGYVWVPPSVAANGRAKSGRWKLAADNARSGIGVVGACAYVAHPTFEILNLRYNLKDGTGSHQWKPGMPPPLALYAHIARGEPIEAFNAGFEMWVWEVMVRLYGAPPLPLEQVRCAMAKGRAWAMPPALAKVGEVLGVEHGKDKDGKRLVDKFSIPRNPTKADARLRIRPEDDPIDGPKLDAYNDRDILAEAEVSARVPDLSPDEQEYWFIDQRINRRGIAIDQDGLHNCIAIIEQAHRQYNAELKALTGGAVRKASEIQKLTKWLAETQGLQMASLDDESVTGALARPLLPPLARRALEIRAAVGSASVKKVFAIRNQLGPTGRLHDLYVFHGARTGRPTGSGPQPTNLPNSSGVYIFRCDDCARHFSLSLTACPWCGANVE